MTEKLQFIRDSILDIQSTIRVIDTKIAVLLVILLSPLSNLGSISTHIESFVTKFPDCFDWFIVLIFIISWVLSVIAAIRVISSIDNPASHIVNNDKYSGVFYSGGLYSAGILDVFFNRLILKASKDVDRHLTTFPDSDESIEKELVFEQMKLVYIRDLKLCRLSFSISATFIWLPVGLFIYSYSRFL